MDHEDAFDRIGCLVTVDVPERHKLLNKGVGIAFSPPACHALCDPPLRMCGALPRSIGFLSAAFVTIEATASTCLVFDALPARAASVIIAHLSRFLTLCAQRSAGVCRYSTAPRLC